MQNNEMSKINMFAIVILVSMYLNGLRLTT